MSRRTTQIPTAIQPSQSQPSSLPIQPTQSQPTAVTAIVPGESPNNLYPAPANHEIETPSMMTNNAAVVAALQGKCDFPKNKMLREYTKEVNAKGHKLENQPYYAGMLSADDMIPYLKKPGDFGIHACDQDGGEVRLMLTVRGSKSIHHFDLVFDGKGRGWNFQPRPPGCPFHKTIIELVEFHKTCFLPGLPEDLCLGDSITRPSWFLKHENVTFGKDDLLGKGNFCEVFRGKLDRRKLIAVKVCNANWRYTVDASKNTKEKDAREALIKEGSVMSRIRHPNVITFYGICCDHPPIMIAIEFCPGNSLIKHLDIMKEEISVGERIKYLCESAAGMAFLEKNECVHRDLAARNCLISRYGKIKIADFGLSKLVSQLAGEAWTAQQVPVRWMAPETLKRSPEYSSKSDVWAFGILTFEVFTSGEKPWADWENKKIATYIRHGKMGDLVFPDNTPSQIRNLVTKMWTVKKDDRPTFMEILKRINEIQGIFPPPKLQHCTVMKIKGVTVPATPDVEKDDDDSEDIQITAAVAAVNKRESTDEPASPIQETKKKKKIYRTGCRVLDFVLNRGKSNTSDEERGKKKKSEARDTGASIDVDMTQSTDQKPKSRAGKSSIRKGKSKN